MPDLYAFPLEEHSQADWVEIHRGMTLRDYFAAKILAAMPVEIMKEITYPASDDRQSDEAVGMMHMRRKSYAEFAYKMADAMLTEREVKKP